MKSQDTMTNIEGRCDGGAPGVHGLGWSALFDGECAREELDALLADDEAERRDAVWDTYRCIGEALRAHEAALPSAADPAFVRAVMARVQAEPHVAGRLQPQRAPLPPAANAALWRWRAAAAVAALAAVLAVLWPQLQTGGPAGSPWAAAPAAGGADTVANAPAAAPAPTLARDAQLEEFMAAHRSWGAASALHAPAGFLRTVAYDGGVQR